MRNKGIGGANPTNLTAKPYMEGTNFGSKLTVITISAQVLITKEALWSNVPKV